MVYFSFRDRQRVRVMGDKVRVVFIPSNGAYTDDVCFAALPLPLDGPKPIPSDDLDAIVSSWLSHALSAPSSADS